MRHTPLIVAIAILIGPLWAQAQQDTDVLKTLRPAHPRLFVLDEDWSRLKEQIKTDPTAKEYFAKLKKSADDELDKPPAEYVLTGPRLLHVSRLVLGRVSEWAGIYRLTGDERYSKRAIDEMLAVSAFKDWHPSHFLDTAEMSNAVGIGYDWLYDRMTPEQRTTIRTALVEKGLKAGLDVYAKERGFHTTTNNWNQVCNGGLTVGALAIADEEPEIARQIVENARRTIKIAMDQFAPDGGCVEGPGYWGYATRYTVFYLAAIQSALGTDFGYLRTPGLAETGLFRIHSVGPIGKTFNFADAGSTAGRACQMFWFARAFDRPVYAVHERITMEDRGRGVDPFHLFWFNAAGSEADVSSLPLAAMFKRVNVVFMRSSWTDKNAAFVGFKGGDNAASHAHCDLGSFVYDVDGVRWAYDLGADDYNLPGYFSQKTRWNYYRLRSEGQNTLTIDGENQNPKGTAPIIKFESGGGGTLASADLTGGYPKAKRVVREVELKDKELRVKDEIEADSPVEVVWHMHTEAKIQVEADKRHAVLVSGKKRLNAVILEPAEAYFAIAPDDPQPTERSSTPPASGKYPNRDGEKLTVRLPEKVMSLQLVVALIPEADFTSRPKLNLQPTTRP